MYLNVLRKKSFCSEMKGGASQNHICVNEADKNLYGDVTRISASSQGRKLKTERTRMEKNTTGLSNGQERAGAGVCGK